MPTVCLHPWATSQGAREETWAALDAIRRWGPVVVVDAPCLVARDYARALESVWDRGWTVLVVEHDLVPDLDAVHRLLTCHEPVCTQAYPLHPLTTRLPGAVWSPRTWDGHTYSWVESGAEVADAFGLGCTLFRPAAQLLMPARYWRDTDWWLLDSRLSELARAARLRAHVHWPSIRHLHGEPAGVQL